MSTSGTGLYDCPDIQAEVTDYFQTCDAAFLPDPAPLNEFLWSAANRSGIQQVFTPGENKIRKLYLRYDKRLLESEVEEVEDCDRVCTATTKRGDATQLYEIDTCDKLRVSEVMNAEDFKKACRGNMEIVNKKMRIMMNALVRAVASKMTYLTFAHFGGWSTTVDPQISDGGIETFTLNTLKAGSTDINPTAMVDLDMAIQQNGFCSGVAIFAGTTLAKYAQIMNAGCCSNQGIDLQQIMANHGYAVVYDRRVQAQFADAIHAIAIGLGALQPVYYTRNNDGLGDAVGLNVGANYQKQVIYEPSTGIPIDLTISDNCGALSIIMETVVDVKALPADLFAAGDYMTGVNWVNKIKVVNV
jgi:hypothetical protein